MKKFKIGDPVILNHGDVDHGIVVKTSKLTATVEWQGGFGDTGIITNTVKQNRLEPDYKAMYEKERQLRIAAEEVISIKQEKNGATSIMCNFEKANQYLLLKNNLQ